MRARRTRVLGWLLIGLVVVATVEAAGFAYLRVMERRYPRLFAFDIENHVASLPEEYLQAYPDAVARRDIHAPDPLLGWIRVPLSSHTFAAGNTMTTDAIGSRRIPGFEGRALVSTYGESFTEGLEVNDGETWQAYLAAAIGEPVWNFGVSGYGPDQALLALERNLERGLHTPVVLLAMINENFDRLMTTYRAFYTAPFPDKFLAFKPIFVEVGGRYEVRSFIPSDTRDRGALVRALHEAARFDGFYPLRKEHLAFPFSAHAIGFLRRQGIHPQNLTLTGAPETRKRMQYVLERFAALADRYDFVPVFVLLPEIPDEFRTRGGEEQPVLRSLLASPRCARIVFVDIVQLLSGPSGLAYLPDFDRARYLERTHPSAHGNRAIAAVLERELAAYLR